MRRVYLDNAATSFPKAPGVADAVYDYITNVGSNVGRGAYQSAYSAGQVVYQTRELLADLMDFDSPLNAIFTANITHSLNILLKGLLKPSDHVIVSSMEHNAVMRPLTSLSKNGVEFTRVKCETDGTIAASKIEEHIKPETKLVIMTHASNICGTILPIEDVGQICKKHNVYFILDSAQSAGVLDISMKKMNLDAVAFTGHKGLLGPQGIGGFLINDSLAKNVSPFIEGGTGSLSDSELQPSFMPDRFESGTLNIPGIYGLNASLKYIKETGINAIRDIEDSLCSEFLAGVNNIVGARNCGLPDSYNRTSVVSVDFTNYDNSEIAFILDRDYGIMTRVGLHCAPSAHKTLGTFPKGTVRFSFGHFNTTEDVHYAIESINKTLKTL